MTQPVTHHPLTCGILCICAAWQSQRRLAQQQKLARADARTLASQQRTIARAVRCANQQASAAQHLATVARASPAAAAQQRAAEQAACAAAAQSRLLFERKRGEDLLLGERAARRMAEARAERRAAEVGAQHVSALCSCLPSISESALP
jgi:hypothetical protein